MSATLQLTLTYAGQLATEAEMSGELLAAETGDSLGDLLAARAAAIGGRFQTLLMDPATGGLGNTVVVAVDGERVPRPHEFRVSRDHDVFMMTPIAGG